MSADLTNSPLKKAFEERQTDQGAQESVGLYQEAL